MVAHSQTLFAAVALVAIVMGGCLFLAGQFRQRSGMLTTGCGMLCHAFAYVCYSLFDHTSLWISYVLANTLLSTALACYSISIPLIHKRQPRWLLAFAFPLLLCVLLALLIDTLAPRQMTASLMLFGQCVYIFHLARKHAIAGGSAHRILMTGAGISVLGLGIRVVTIALGHATDMSYDVSSLKQTISISLGTATVIMLSFGLVLLSREYLESELKHLARHDPLTGVLNRKAILQRLSDELAHAHRLGSPLGVAMLDLDFFKKINDTHGHLIGDAALQHVCDHITHRLRGTDCIGRYGGEEFLLVLPGTTAEGAMALVKSLRQSLAENPMCTDAGTISLSFSAGVDSVPAGSVQSINELLRRTDIALYAAKHAGRDTQVLAGTP